MKSRARNNDPVRKIHINRGHHPKLKSLTFHILYWRGNRGIRRNGANEVTSQYRESS